MNVTHRGYGERVARRRLHVLRVELQGAKRQLPRGELLAASDNMVARFELIGEGLRDAGIPIPFYFFSLPCGADAPGAGHEILTRLGFVDEWLREYDGKSTAA